LAQKCFERQEQQIESMSSCAKSVPFFSQWESRDITSDVLARGSAALVDDPNWASSGAETIDEYVRWASNLCGMACLKMILAARTRRAFPMLELARRCTAYGGYTVSNTGQIKGLIYAPFIEFIRREFSIDAEIVTGLAADDIAGVLQGADFFIASVHHWIRWPDRNPPARGGHLVLVLEATVDLICFHNPSGHDVRSQEYASIPTPSFDKFFAGRGIAIKA
jgi:hypothetical protein